MVQENSLTDKKKIIIIGGPTAVGKTGLSIEIAKRFNGEIIGADSMQIYRGLDIGTGKITREQMRGIKHYLIDIKNPDEEYSVGEFVKDCKKAIFEICETGKLPIVVGGTGFYINALINGYNLCAASKSERLRNELRERSVSCGKEVLYSELQKIDPVSAAKISPNDLKRVIRALEIFYLTGKPKSFNEKQSSDSEFDYLFFVLQKERERLYFDIDKRVDEMFESGLESEAMSLIDYKSCQSMQAIGYKEIFEAVERGDTAISAKDAVKQNSRRYAKRQMTYFRGMKADKLFVESCEHDLIFDKICNFI